MEYPKNRLILVWVIAARFPSVIVAIATPIVSACHSTFSGRMQANKMRSRIANEATLGPTEMKAVMEVGAPS